MTQTILKELLALYISFVTALPELLPPDQVQQPVHYDMNPVEILFEEAIEPPPFEIEVEVCSSSSVKSYMDYKKLSKSSNQYKLIEEEMTIVDGLLYDEYGFVGVALGSYFGDLGSRYIFTLDTGIELKVIKLDEKDDKHTYDGCIHRVDQSVIEFVVDDITNKFYVDKKGMIAGGNFNNLPQFEGSIVKITKEVFYD